MTKTISISLAEQGAHAEYHFDNLYVLDNYIRGMVPGQAFERSVVSESEGQLYAVFDGMGEGELGVEASRVAAEILDEHRQRLAADPEIPFKTFVRDYVTDANNAICDRIRLHKGLRMGTTCSLLYLRDGIARTANIGNSRIYLYRGESLIQLTYDHTQAQKLVRLGIIGREETQSHPERNVLTQYLGIFPEEMALEPSFGPTVILQKKDTFLAACNGLTDSLDEAALRAGLAEPGVFSDLPHRLVRASLDAGSLDNLTLTVVRIMDTDTELAKRAAGALNDVTTQIPAGEIDRAATAPEPPGFTLPPIPSAASTSARTAQDGFPASRSARVWRVLTPVLIFLCFVIVGIGAAKIAFSWDAITGRTKPTTAATTTAPATDVTAPSETTAPAGPTTVPAEPTTSPAETTPSETTATTPSETTAPSETTSTTEPTTAPGTTPSATPTPTVTPTPSETAAMTTQTTTGTTATTTTSTSAG